MRVNDLDLHVEVGGRGPPLLLLHGFTGSTRTWDPIRPALEDVATLVSLDLVGHGGSAAPVDAARYRLESVGRDLLALLDALGLSQVDVLGYSMGGRLALQFAVEHPRRVRRLVLESASPGIEAATERARRLASDAALADRIEADGIEVFVAEWERQPLLDLAPHVTQAVRDAQHAQRLAHTARGLANSLRGMGAAQQAPLWTSLPGLAMRVEIIVGARDARYVGLGERMRARLPRCALHVVADAGHTVHLDQPATFAAVVRDALTRN